MKTELIAISELRVEAPFSSLFPIGKETLEAIATDMRAGGFDDSFPLIVWEGKNVVVDGHTRFAAARELNLEAVPVLYKNFENEDDAILYCFHIQRNRRNLADDDILRCLEVLDNINPPVRENKKERDGTSLPPVTKKEKDILRAKELGTSVAKAQKARKLLEHGDDEIKQSVASGEKSINQAYQEVQEQRRESGELKGKSTTGLGNTAKYTKALGNFLRELARLKDNNWEDVPKQKVFEDLASITKFVES
ncbi:ParB/RepB/Spo0J family partition protein [Desulfocicer vacuolatum]|uniref:ParB/RepB/Spo0J family partition protein n=1 Tax=Desulfocicer vacuolatum TaxID=2298 RepID=UPI001E4BE2DF|nr:ParB/RepB/Spo0J family partition protein [Desulfocicer vacuolatum]